MEEIEGSIFDGDTVVVAGATVLLDVLDAVAGSTDSTGWHAHVALPLGTVVEPGQPTRLETAVARQRDPRGDDAPQAVLANGEDAGMTPVAVAPGLPAGRHLLRRRSG